MKANILYKAVKENPNEECIGIALYDNHQVIITFMDGIQFYHDYPTWYQADLMFMALCRMTSITIEVVTPYGFRELQ